MSVNSTTISIRFDQNAGILSKQIITLVQLIYGFPTVCLMGYIFIHLATSSKYKNSFYRLVQVDLLIKYERFWSRYYIPMFLLFFIYSVSQPRLTPDIDLEVINGALFLVKNTENWANFSNKYFVFASCYITVLLVLGITVARLAKKKLQGTISANQGVSRKLTKIALTNGFVYSGIMIYTLANILGPQIPFLPTVLLEYATNILTTASDLNFLKNEDVVGLYVSASFDDDDVLANVMVVSGNDQISRMPANSGNLQPYPIQPNSYITSNLADIQLANLKGVLYYNTVKQFANQYFYVIDVHSAFNFNLEGLGDVKTTVVFLNTMTNMIPNFSSKISNWQQDSNASVAIYNGIPQDGIKPKNTQIFSNPVHSDIFDWFYFKNVETFSLSSVAFYLDSFKGCTFKIEPGKAILGGTTTTALTTTGFYMKSLGEQQTVTRVNMMKDANSNGYTGANILGHVPNGATVTFYVEDNGKNYGTGTVPADFFAPWSTAVVGDDIVINSTNAQMGQYFVQYFVIQGVKLNVTTAAPGDTTTVPLETTTKLSGRVFTEFLCMVILILGSHRF
ncbi:hypothetical protein B9Z55_018064 [Caenorhabditis nigoni]|uniref:Serpentine receptor class gamma n=1 Tax=Caenorhabditis nigoni TaxID=1611254 RepID=A0A2G5TCM5_9PELO|nr:hypothetical protein B9Z55_018064 [Caenorhabditis nigoni]